MVKKQKNLGSMNIDELKSQYMKLIEERTEAVMQHKTGQLKQTHKISHVKRAIANIKRLMHDMSA